MPRTAAGTTCGCCHELIGSVGHPQPRSACPNTCINIAGDGKPCGVSGSSRPAGHRAGCQYHPASEYESDSDDEPKPKVAESKLPGVHPVDPFEVPGFPSVPRPAPVPPGASGLTLEGLASLLLKDKREQEQLRAQESANLQLHLRRQQAQHDSVASELRLQIASLTDSHAILRRNHTSAGGGGIIYLQSEPRHNRIESSYPRREEWRQYSQVGDDSRIPFKATQAFCAKTFGPESLASIYNLFSDAGRLELDTIYTSQSFLKDITVEFSSILNTCHEGWNTAYPTHFARLQKNLGWLQDLEALWDNRFTEIKASKDSPVLSSIKRRQAQNERLALQYPDKAYAAEMLALSEEVAKAQLSHAIKQQGKQRESLYKPLFDYMGTSARAASRESAKKYREGPESTKNSSPDRFTRRPGSGAGSRDPSRTGGSRDSTPFRSASRGSTPFRSRPGTPGADRDKSPAQQSWQSKQPDSARVKFDKR